MMMESLWSHSHHLLEHCSFSLTEKMDGSPPRRQMLLADGHGESVPDQHRAMPHPGMFFSEPPRGHIVCDCGTVSCSSREVW